MTEMDLNESQVTEVDGIGFKTILSNIKAIAPQKKEESKTEVQLGIYITNNRQTPFRFSQFRTLTPEVAEANGQVLQRLFFRHRRVRPQEWHFPLVLPGESVALLPDSRLIYRQSHWRLNIAFEDGGYNKLDFLDNKTYYLRFIYENCAEIRTIQNRSPEGTDTKVLKNIWTGKVITPPLEFRLM